MSVLQVADHLYDEAASEVAAERAIQFNETNLDVPRISQVIRSYVWCGLEKLIRDWGENLSSTQRETIFIFVRNRTAGEYGFTPDRIKAYRTLDLLVELDVQGRINPIIAWPRQYEEAAEQGSTGFGDQFVHDLKANVKKVFVDLPRSILGGVLQAIGIDIPVDTILIVGAAGIGYYVFRKRR